MNTRSEHLTAALTATYQTRLKVSSDADAVLSAVAERMSQVERCLYKEIRKGRSSGSPKNEFLTRFGITARYFNFTRMSLDGKIDSVLSNLKRVVGEYDDRIKGQQSRIAKLSKRLKTEKCPEKRKSILAQMHQRKRRIATLEARKARLQARLDNKDPAICFGSKRLFGAQYRLIENSYSSHAEWREEWQRSRKAQFGAVGSKDETAGNQTCQLTLADDGSYTAQLRVPDGIVEQLGCGKYLTLTGLSFAYGDEAIRAALASNEKRKQLSSKVNKEQFPELYKAYGQALTYRFLKDEKGWRVFVTTSLQPTASVSRAEAGTLGVDLNADHLAVALIDRHGNPVNKWTVPCSTYGLTSDQARAVIGDACKEVVELATTAGVPIATENLKFSKKKAELEVERNKRYARMLSGLSYDLIKQTLISRAYRHGVEVYAVNPAHTSTIGRAKFAAKYGYSVHHAAAVAIARRFMNCTEKLPQGRSCLVWDDRAGHVTLPVPEDTGRHVWSRWGALRRSLSVALAGHPQRRKRPPDPLHAAAMSALDDNTFCKDVPF